jgi:hypothetical protein
MTSDIGIQLRDLYEANSSVRSMCDVFRTYKNGVYQIMTHNMETYLIAAMSQTQLQA